MKRVLVPVVVGILFAAACASQKDVARPAAQDDFGVQMAKMSLWREAMFRFQRAVKIDPNDARAHNNLAVAYEATGDFENARKEYLEALRLDRSNSYIQKNYSRFVEFLSRNRKRQQKDTKTAGPSMPKPGGSATATDAFPTPPTRPVATDAPKPVNAPAPPSDLPPPDQPRPPVTTPQPPVPTPPAATAPTAQPPTPPPGVARLRGSEVPRCCASGLDHLETSKPRNLATQFGELA